MPEDDAMDLHDEKVEAASKAIFNVRRQPLTWGELPGANKEWYRERAAAAFRAVPESDEQEASENRRRNLYVAVEMLKCYREMGAPGRLGTIELDQFLGSPELAAALSPDEAAGDE